VEVAKAHPLGLEGDEPRLETAPEEARPSPEDDGEQGPEMTPAADAGKSAVVPEHRPQGERAGNIGDGRGISR
jgi:hypothetical protein